MYRFTLFLDCPIRLGSLPLDPEHSLIRQSTHASSTKWLSRYRFSDADYAGHGGIFLKGQYRSQAVILPQVFRTAAMRCKVAPRLASWRPSQDGQERPLVLIRFSAELCNLPETVLVNRSLFTIDGNRQRPKVLCMAAMLPNIQNRLPRRDIFVKHSTVPPAELAQSIGDMAKRFPSNICANMFLPKNIYEALPAAYIAVGTSFILGAVYIGIDHRPMVGYLAVGLSCIFAGVAVNSIRRRERSMSKDTLA